MNSNSSSFTLIILLLLTVSSYQSWFPPLSSIPEDPSKSLEDISLFFEGFFDHFNLKKPSQIIDCFSLHSASSFFKELHEANEILTAMNNRNVLALRSEFFKQYLFGISHSGTVACIALTQDLEDLFKKLDIKTKDPHLFANVNFLYPQAHYPKLLKAFQPIIMSLNVKSFLAAGEFYGKLIRELATSVQTEGLGYLTIKGFANGYAHFHFLEERSEFVTEKSIYLGGVAMDLLLRLATVVSEGETEESYDNTVKFWGKEGKEILEQIPLPVWYQLGWDEDQYVTDKVVRQILNWKFYDRQRMEYIKKHQVDYHMKMKLIKENMGRFHVFHAGYLYAELIHRMTAE